MAITSKISKLYSCLFVTLLGFILAAISTYQAPSARASEFTLTCSPPASSCTMTPVSGKALFDIRHLLPGESVTRTFTISNQSLTDTCHLNLKVRNYQDTNHLGTVLNTAIHTQSQTLYGSLAPNQAQPNKTLSQILSDSPLTLISIPPEQTSGINWTLTFHPTAGNQFQATTTLFDFDLNFSCGTPPSASPTPSPSTGSGDSGTGGPSSYSTPICNAPPPATAPNLTASPTAPNSAFLSWSSVEPVTHYMIRYGTSPNDFIYGAANVGNINSYLVQSLSAGNSYSFQVTGVNDCMPGPWSNTASITPTGDIFAPGPAPGFSSQILGLTDNLSLATPSAQASTSALTTGQVAGDTCTDPAVSWWPPLVLQLIFTLYHYLRLRHRHPRPPTWWLPPLLMGLISLIIHLLRGCNCATHLLCPYSPLINLSILVLTTTGFLALSSPTSHQTSSKKK